MALMEGGSRKTLIPCYQDMDAYELPDEFAALQGLDLGKLGAIQDLLRGVEKIIGGRERGKKISDSRGDGGHIDSERFFSVWKTEKCRKHTIFLNGFLK